jgi:hypothetical protein
LHIIDAARDDPKLERPEAFMNAFYAALERSENDPRKNQQLITQTEIN